MELGPQDAMIRFLQAAREDEELAGFLRGLAAETVPRRSELLAARARRMRGAGEPEALVRVLELLREPAILERALKVLDAPGPDEEPDAALALAQGAMARLQALARAFPLTLSGAGVGAVLARWVPHSFGAVAEHHWAAGPWSALPGWTAPAAAPVLLPQLLLGLLADLAARGRLGRLGRGLPALAAAAHYAGLLLVHGLEPARWVLEDRLFVPGLLAAWHVKVAAATLDRRAGAVAAALALSAGLGARLQRAADPSGYLLRAMRHVYTEGDVNAVCAGLGRRLESLHPVLLPMLAPIRGRLDHNIQYRAVRAYREGLGRLAPGPAAEAVQALARLLESRPPDFTSWAAVDALGKLGEKADPAVPALLAQMWDGDLFRAAEALNRIGTPKARAALRSKEARAAADAWLQSMAELGHPLPKEKEKLDRLLR